MGEPISIEGVGRFAYQGLMTPKVARVYTDVERFSTVGNTLLEHTAEKLRVIVSATHVRIFGTDDFELRLEFSDNVEDEATKKRVARTFISVFRDVCAEHMVGLEYEPITCRRAFTLETLREMDREVAQPPMGETT